VRPQNGSLLLLIILWLASLDNVCFFLLGFPDTAKLLDSHVLPRNFTQMFGKSLLNTSPLSNTYVIKVPRPHFDPIEYRLVIWKFVNTFVIVILVQIRFLKTRYLGQHNEDKTMINPTIPLNTLFLGLLRAYGQSLDPVILDSKMNM